MATYGSDEEQIEALKAWWSENGSSLITGIVLVLVAFFGVRQWQGMQTAESARASDLYQQIAELAVARLSQPVTDEDLQAAQAAHAQLQDEHQDSIYTRYAALALARFQVEQDQLEQAAGTLQWILDNPKLGLLSEVDPELLQTARLRLARVKLSQDDAQAALALLRAGEAGTFAAAYAEVEGDALLSLGQREEAISAYRRALADPDLVNPGLLPLKLQDLGVEDLEAP